MSESDNGEERGARVAFIGQWLKRRGRDNFELLLRPHIAEMFRVAARLTGDASEAEDLIQSVLVRLYGRVDQLALIQELRPWLVRTVYNEFVDHWRRRQRSPAVESGLPAFGEPCLLDSAVDPADDIESWVERAQFRERLSQAVNCLADEHREVIILHDIEGYTMDEIETIAGVPIGTIKSRLHRARARLRDMLQWP